jgi:hypothetical protein
MSKTKYLDAAAPKKKRARVTNVLVDLSASDETLKFLSRGQLAARWCYSTESVKRMTRAGVLHPIYLNSRKLLYPIAEIEALEADAKGVLR